MTSRQVIAVVAPVVLVAVMIPVFRLYARAFPGNWRIGWYLGLITYWVLWCGVFPWLMIGKDGILALIRPQPLTPRVALLASVPLVGAALYRLVPGMAYEKPQLWVFLLLISTNIGNGLFEEILWRGMYLELFPNSLVLGLIWPCLWFALWHYAPGAIAPDGNPLGLIIGSGMMGVYLSFLARQTGTIWWTILAHALGGFIMIL